MFRDRRDMSQPEPEIDEQEVLRLSEQLAAANDVLETSKTSGWKHIVATLEHEIYMAEQAILRQDVSEPVDVAVVRGQIKGFKTLIDIPKAAQMDRERFMQQLQETERPA